MTTTSLPVVIGVFRDHRLAEQALEALKQTSWEVDNAHIIERNGHGIFGAFKGVRASRETTEEAIPDELAQVDLPEEQRQLYQHELAHGATLVLAHPQSHLLEVRDILNRHGAYHVFVPFQVGGEQTISLRQEVPQVHKQVAEVGEVRLHKRVITEDRTFTIPVTREEVTIERVPLSSASQAAEPDASTSRDTAVRTTASSPVEGEVLSEEGTLRILVREEQVIIQKQVVVVEEIIVRKQIIEDTKHLVEPLKHEEVHIERIGKVAVHENSVQEDY